MAKPKMVKVRALKIGDGPFSGFDGLAMRKPGEVFEMPDGVTGRWYETISDADAESAAPEPKRNIDSDPRTFSEIAKARKPRKFAGVEVPT